VSARAPEEKTLNLIPTPHKLRLGGGNPKTYTTDRVYTISLMEDESEKLLFTANYLKHELGKRFGLHFNIRWREKPTRDEDIVIHSHPVTDITHPPFEPDATLFEQKNGAEQGYIAVSSPGAPVSIYARSEQGAQYGVATLVQLFSDGESGPALPNLLTEDLPQFTYRGNRWLIKVESGNWGYDWGDGIGAYMERIRHKLDMAMQYKVNVIIFDGFGWGTDVFPEYAAVMRELNREARLRGIHLMHSGYGAGIAGGYRSKPDLLRGPVLENRRSYPDGEIYHCIAGEHYCGTCLSNESLMALRLDGIRKFVEEVEPGALYIHQQDEGLTPATWVKRCPECRKRWPSDEVAADDGMAGAYASLYNRLIEAVHGVETDAYSASEDCLIVPISPGYLSYGLNDDEWNIGLEYWSTLSALLTQRKNVYPGFREIFVNHTNNSRRAPELKAAFEKSGEEQGFAIIFFYGADSHHNDKLFLSAPVLNYVFDGVDMLLSASGTSYSEPLQLLNAEYMWNPYGSAFFSLPQEPVAFADFKKLYFECQYGEFQPAAIFQDFLRTACVKLYGEVAGGVMHEVFLVEGKNHEPPVPYVDNSSLIRGDMKGAEAEGGAREGSVFIEYGWPLNDASRKRKLIGERIGEMLAATVRAATTLAEGLKKNDIDPSSEDYMRWFAASLDEGVFYTGCLAKYIQIIDASETTSKASTASQADRLLIEVAEKRERSSRSILAPVDYLGGTQSGRSEILDFVESNLQSMLSDIRPNSGKEK